jgi:hypothetical protein
LVDFECTKAADIQSCAYSGDDERFVPAADERVIVGIEPEGVADPIDGVSIFTSASTDGGLRTGLVDDNGLRRFVGVHDGVGEFEGKLIQEEGWGRLDGNTFAGTIRLNVITS